MCIAAAEFLGEKFNQVFEPGTPRSRSRARSRAPRRLALIAFFFHCASTKRSPFVPASAFLLEAMTVLSLGVGGESSAR